MASVASATPVHTDAFLAETLQPNIYAACIIPFILAIAAICARFWCRWIKSAGYKTDDFLMIPALVRSHRSGSTLALTSS